MKSIELLIMDNCGTRQGIRMDVTQALKSRTFKLYMDDCGNSHPTKRDNFPYFALGGVLFDQQDQNDIEAKISNFRDSWPQIGKETPLHAYDIRQRTANFSWLARLPQKELSQFYSDLVAMTADCPILIHACVIDRQGYYDRFMNEHGPKLWDMRKSACAILLERTAKYAQANTGKLMVFYERSSKPNDRLIEEVYKEMKANGAPFNSQTSSIYSPLTGEDFQKIGKGVQGKTKSSLIMQLADLCLFPVVAIKMGKQKIPYDALKEARRIIDFHLPEEHRSNQGIKYYCFPAVDSPKNSDTCHLDRGQALRSQSM